MTTGYFNVELHMNIWSDKGITVCWGMKLLSIGQIL